MSGMDPTPASPTPTDPSGPRRAGVYAAALALLFLSLAVHADLPRAALSADTKVATAGYYRLSWHAVDAGGVAVEYELQAAADAAFGASSTLYEGPDLARVISGRPDGERYYRVRVRSGDGRTGTWSEAVAVTTTHHPLARALGFFAAGAVVFAATLGMVLRGPRD